MVKVLYLLPVLACPVGMGLMMWLMMRPKKGQPAGSEPNPQQQELAQLRSEIASLRRDRPDAPATQEHRPASR